jgi:hypothetical protein
MLIAAAMSAVGLVGPAVNHIALRQIGIVGYAIVWPIVCLPLSRASRQRPTAGAAPLAPGPEPEQASQDTGHQTSHRACCAARAYRQHLNPPGKLLRPLF